MPPAVLPLYKWGSGPTEILFLHGFLGSAQDGAFIQDHLSADTTVYAMDLPGHGKSGALAPDTIYSMEETAALVVATMNAAHIKAPLLYGYSMGGRLALYLALKYHHLFSSLLLESASPGLATVGEREDRKKMDELRAQKVLSQGIPTFIQEWYTLPLFAGLHRNKAAFEEMMILRLINNAEGIAHSLRAMGTGAQPCLWQQMGSLQLPTKLVVGEKDKKFVHIAQKMASLSPQCSITIIPAVGHTIHRENPNALLSVLSL